MSQVGLALDYPSLDELFILKALLDRGLEPVLLFPYADFLSPADVQGLEAVINRVQHRYRRLRVAEHLSIHGSRCFNPFAVEYLCSSKVTMKRAFDRAQIPSAPWLLTEYPLGILEDGRLGWSKEFTDRIVQTIEQTIGFPVVTKATEGSRGSAILRIDGRKEFFRLIQSQLEKRREEVPGSLFPNIANPEGFFVEQYLAHPFDLRCLVSYREETFRFLGCLARVGAGEQDISKSTVYGFLPVGIEAPDAVVTLAVRTAEAALAYTEALFGATVESFLVGLDIIASTEDQKPAADIYSAVRKADADRKETELAMEQLDAILDRSLQEHGRALEGIWADLRFQDALEAMDRAFERFRSREVYVTLQGKVLRFLKTANLYVSEINSRIDFARITRVLCLPDLQDQIVKAALR